MVLDDKVKNDVTAIEPEDAIYLPQGSYARTSVPLDGYLAVFARKNGTSIYKDAVVAQFGKEVKVPPSIAKRYADEVKQLLSEHPVEKGHKLSGIIIYRTRSRVGRSNGVDDVLECFKKVLSTRSIRATGFGGYERISYDLSTNSWHGEISKKTENITEAKRKKWMS